MFLDSILYLMKILDKYFTRQLVGIFVMLLMILTGLSWMVQIMSMMKFLISYGVKLTNFLGLTVMMVPFILSIIVPFVTFIAVLFVYNKMIGDNEVVVMVSSGTSPGKIARPALVLAGLLTAANLVLNLWIVPATQAKFYDTQWNLRYGLAHLKLQEGAFTEMTRDLVVYVDKVSGYDLNHVMLSDTRKDKSQMIIFAENGKLITTMRGLSIVMTKGAMQATGNGSIIGTFDSFDMDLSIATKNNSSSFKTRRMPTGELLRYASQDDLTVKQRKTVLTELCNRFLQPMMNLILAALCLAILLRSSLLRRRASFAPALSVVSMSVVMAAFMSASNMLETTTHLFLLGGAQAVLFGIIMVVLLKK